MKILFLLILLILIIICFPLLSIWALNVLFSLGIGYTLKTWFAMTIVNVLILGNAKKG